MAHPEFSKLIDSFTEKIDVGVTTNGTFLIGICNHQLKRNG